LALDTMDKVVAALAAGQRLPVLKTTLALEAAGVWASLWTAAGMPAAGARAQRQSQAEGPVQQRLRLLHRSEQGPGR
jgi:hypothetical protein